VFIPISIAALAGVAGHQAGLAFPSSTNRKP
jgi:hypothetical protein